MNETAAVFCADLQYSYETDTPQVLRGLNIEIAKGEFAVIAGPSGEGKSTFCRTLNNIIPLFYKGSFSGKRRVAGEWLEKQHITEISKKVGMVFQDFEQQLFSTNVLLDLAFGLENFGVPHAEMQKRIAELLEKFNLTHLKDREPSSLSGGEKQKVAIASVMAYRPQVLVLDEPTTDLDADSREFVLQTLPQLKDWVETVLVIDQETEQFETANRIFLFREGVIQAEGSAGEILICSDLLEQNALRPLDLVRLQTEIGRTPVLVSPSPLAAMLQNQTLEKIPLETRTQSQPVVEVGNLSFRYPGESRPALKNLSFEIREGEFAGIIGHNGSGKSTLLKHLNGLQHPQQGAVRILGKDVREWDRKELARAAGLVFQNPDHQIFNATVREEVEFGPRQFGLPEERRKKDVERAIETMDLLQQLERDPFQLSKGERQRVAVASVLSVSPDILILDEPTTGLDYRQQKYLMELLQKFHREGTTIVIVTHALKLVAEYCTYSVVLHQGETIAEGHPREVFFGDRFPLRLPPLLELSKLMNGNALSVNEFKTRLHQ